MLDPAKILETMKAGGNLGTNSQSSLSQPFMQGVSNIQMSGPDAAKSVMSNVTKSCDDMFGNMKGIFNGLQSNVNAHQKCKRANSRKILMFLWTIFARRLRKGSRTKWRTSFQSAETVICDSVGNLPGAEMPPGIHKEK